jgi:zinc protease
MTSHSKQIARRLEPLVAILLAFTALTSVAINSFALDIKRSTLSNGAILLVSEQHQLPMVTMAIAFDAGSRRDPKGKEGLAELTADSLTEGTKELSSEELNQKIDFMGSSLGVSAGQDYADASFTSLSKYSNDTLHLLATVLTSPALKDKEVIRKRNEQVDSIKSDNEQPGYVAEREFSKQLFGDTPYGHPPEGTVESVQKLKPTDVRNFYKQYYKTTGAIISVVGDINADQIKASLEKELAGLEGTVPPQDAPPTPTVPPGVRVTKLDRNVTQANLVLGFGGVARSDPDFYRLQVMNYIFGGGSFASRLMKEVRSKHGLAYSISSGFETGKFPGSFRIVLQTKNQSANQAIQMVLQQMHEIQDSPVSDDEIDGAKKFLVGSFPLKIDKQSSIASFLVQIEFYGLGLDYADKYPGLVNSVTKADVQRVAKQYLHSDAYLMVAAANLSEAKIEVPGAEGTATPSPAPSAGSTETPAATASAGGH